MNEKRTKLEEEYGNKKNLMQMWEMHAILEQECFEFQECKRSIREPAFN